MNDQKDLTIADAEKIIEAIVGDDSNPSFATSPMRSGDIGLVLRADGGIEILSIMPDNPDANSISGLGMRGLFALTLFKVAHDPELMVRSLQIVNRELNAEGGAAIKLQ